MEHNPCVFPVLDVSNVLLFFADRTSESWARLTPSFAISSLGLRSFSTSNLCPEDSSPSLNCLFRRRGNCLFKIFKRNLALPNLTTLYLTYPNLT
jgi:hypothetical protein